MTLSFFIATGAAFFGASSVHREGLYDVYIIAIVLLYSLCLVVLTAIIFKILTVFERTISFNDKLISSILLSLFLIFFYHFFLSTWIEKQGIINSYKKELNQLNYELYEPTYIPVGHNLKQG